MGRRPPILKPILIKRQLDLLPWRDGAYGTLVLVPGGGPQWHLGRCVLLDHGISVFAARFLPLEGLVDRRKGVYVGDGEVRSWFPSTRVVVSY